MSGMKALLQQLKNLALRYERRFSALGFALGFLWDSLTLRQIDRLFEQILLAAYLGFTFLCIAFLHAHGAGRFQLPAHERFVLASRFLLPFFLGGLMSGLIVFYSRSGSFLTSWPFLLVLLLLFVGNELFRRHYDRLTFQLSVFFAALLSYTVLVVPVLSRRLGGEVFLLGGAAAVLIFLGVLRILAFVAREEVQRSQRVLLPIVAAIFLLFNFLYFVNAIPPVPLSLQEIGVYHDVRRTAEGMYLMRYEAPPWYAFWKSTATRVHRTAGAPLYVWNAVYAPTRFATEIVHRWSHWNEVRGEWIASGTVRFPISGGRAEGYRGYSLKRNITPGKWRVTVETMRGQVIGRIDFEVYSARTSPQTAKALR